MNMNMAFNLQDLSILFSNNKYSKIFYLMALSSTICFYALVSKRRPPLPPGPRGLPVLGNLPFLQPDLHRQLAKLSKTYGPIFKLQLGTKLNVVITSPSLAKQVLQGPNFTNRDPSRAASVAFHGGVNDITWRNSGPELRNLRRIVSHDLLGHESLRGSFQFCRREVDLMVEKLHGKSGSVVDVGEEVMGTLLNILMTMFWGNSLSSEEDERVRAECKNALNEFAGLLGEFNVSDYFPSFARFDLQGVESRMKRASLWFDHVLETAIASKKENGSTDHRDFLQVLLESSLRVEQAKGVLVDMILAGTYLPLVTIEWAITRLLRNPNQMRRVQEELDTVIGPQTIVEDSHLEKLVYLEAVMREVLRLHPPIPLLIPHTPIEPSSLSGYTIPKGCRLMFNVWAMQRDQEAWDNPLEFEPERFLKNPREYDFQGNNYNYMPFGSGRRVCVGSPLAKKMILYVLAKFLHSFEWRTSDGVEPDLSEKFGGVLRKEKPLVMIPILRLLSTQHI